MNKTILIGRLTADPVLKFTPGNGTAVTTCTLAVDRKVAKDKPKEADFIPVVIWGKIAENTANYMNKGSLMGVSGHIQTRTYDAKDGTKRYVTEVVAEEVQFLDKKDSNSNNNTSPVNNQATPDNSYGDMTPVDNGDDIPFS